MKLNTKKFVCFITGASGVGKSTLAKHLKLKYGKRDNIAILGFDTINVPSTEKMIKAYGSPSEWQRIATKKWVAKIINDIKEPIVILEGQVSFEFIHEAFDYKFQSFKVILIDCKEKEMIKRLEKDRFQPELANKDMKSWRVHLRQQAENYQAPIIDTIEISAQQAMQKLEELLKDELN